MLVKVCGMRDAENVHDVAELGISFMGFIFYDRSARFVSGQAPTTPSGVQRVGVFVNASIEFILDLAQRQILNYIQLHGAESVELCREVKAHGLGVIKAISVASSSDITLTSQYDGEVDYLLFDTKSSGYGGSGQRFDWSVLDNYSGETPFLLSGGVDETMADEISKISHPQFVGVDLNSRFETSPAVKSVEKLKKFIEKLKK